MSFIDWSDPDEMLGLLAEYVSDEAAASCDDPEREQFLSQLEGELSALAGREGATAHQIASALRELIDAQPKDFTGDHVMAHLEACVEELHRIETVQRLGED